MNTTTTRAQIVARNTRIAESRFGRYARRYTVSMRDRTDSTVFYDGTNTSDLLRAVDYVESVRAGGRYGAVMLYDRVEGRHVTQGDVRRARIEYGMAEVAA